jgi:hypothetical protein
MKNGKIAGMQLFRIITCLISCYIVLSTVKLKTLGKRTRSFAGHIQRQHVPRLNPIRTFHRDI